MLFLFLVLLFPSFLVRVVDNGSGRSDNNNDRRFFERLGDPESISALRGDEYDSKDPVVGCIRVHVVPSPCLVSFSSSLQVFVSTDETETDRDDNAIFSFSTTSFAETLFSFLVLVRIPVLATLTFMVSMWSTNPRLGFRFFRGERLITISLSATVRVPAVVPVEEGETAPMISVLSPWRSLSIV